jgi:predicted aminopeptidase
VWFLLASGLLFAGPFGIDVGYYVHLGIGQWNLIWGQRPISDVIKDEATSPNTRSRLLLAEDIRDFAIGNLGLEGSDNYTSLVDVGEGPVVWALTVCEPDKLEPHRWSYPVIGSAPYRGFFNRSRGVREKEKYDEQGYDTYLRGVGAFSTLGWFRDPLLSTMLRYPAQSLADVIIHELTHATIWIEGDADFNESLATFVGRQGAREWVLQAFESGADSLAASEQNQADRNTYRTLMHTLATRLDSVYALDLERAAKIKLKGAAIQHAREVAVDLPWETERYANLESWEINNATLGIFRTYNRKTDIFDRVLEMSGSLKTALGIFEMCEGQKEPEAYLEKWLAKQETSK